MKEKKFIKNDLHDSMNSLYNSDKKRYPSHSHMPLFQKYLRKHQDASGILKHFYKIFFYIFRIINHVEISSNCKIGEGLYIGHPYSITINPKAIIGKNCNIHKGVTIGQENRGTKKGTPIIGDFVWMGINSIIVGNIKIGNNVLIAPNSYINCDVPDNSIVFGNPCIIKHNENATENYINNIITI